MPNLLLQPLTQWPNGEPIKGADGQPLAAISRPDTDLAIIPGASGVDEVSRGAAVSEIGVTNAFGGTRPTDAEHVVGEGWYVRDVAGRWLRTEVEVHGNAEAIENMLRRHPDLTSAERDRIRTEGLDTSISHRPRAVSVLPLSSVPQGVDVFVCVSFDAVGFGPSNLAEIGMATRAPTRDPSLPALYRFNGPVQTARRTGSRWMPHRTGAQMSSSYVVAPDGSTIPVTAMCARLADGESPPVGPSLTLVATVGGVPWFASTNPAEASRGPILGDSVAAISTRVDTALQYLPGTFAVQVSSARWIVMRLRPE